MIHDELVTYEVAKLAKYKGFPQNPNENNHCDMYCWDGLRNIHPLGNWVVWCMEEYNHENLYAAPTQSLLQRWLRKKKNIHIGIVATACGYFWIADETNGTAITNSDILDRDTNEGGCWDEYEQALEDAFRYIFENLI